MSTSTISRFKPPSFILPLSWGISPGRLSSKWSPFYLEGQWREAEFLPSYIRFKITIRIFSQPGRSELEHIDDHNLPEPGEHRNLLVFSLRDFCPLLG